MASRVSGFFGWVLDQFGVSHLTAEDQRKLNTIYATATVLAAKLAAAQPPTDKGK